MNAKQMGGNMSQMNGKQGVGMQPQITQNITNNTNSRINRDSVNITNSIIVSNSQIVF
jgi:hypothetical protein